MRAYLDIETSYSGAVTVVGVFIRETGELVQLVGSDIHAASILAALEGVEQIFTFNGLAFDLPVIRKRVGLDLKRDFHIRDLMWECRKLGLTGGLKQVELSLGIHRSETEGMDGREAMALWERYLGGDAAALALLLVYNRDDIVNLSLIEDCIAGLEG